MHTPALAGRGHDVRNLGRIMRPTAARVQVDEMRGSPMTVGSLEEIIDEKCAPKLAW